MTALVESFLGLSSHQQYERKAPSAQLALICCTAGYATLSTQDTDFHAPKS